MAHGDSRRRRDVAGERTRGGADAAEGVDGVVGPALDDRVLGAHRDGASAEEGDGGDEGFGDARGACHSACVCDV